MLLWQHVRGGLFYPATRLGWSRTLIVKSFTLMLFSALGWPFNRELVLVYSVYPVIVSVYTLYIVLYQVFKLLIYMYIVQYACVLYLCTPPPLILATCMFKLKVLEDSRNELSRLSARCEELSLANERLTASVKDREYKTTTYDTIKE